jgi:hypothetical protein
VLILVILWDAFQTIILSRRREVSISMLDARAGSPPTAARLLRRHFRDGGEDLRAFLREERWSAELLESHVSFPLLAYFRSQHENQSWVAARCRSRLPGAPIPATA